MNREEAICVLQNRIKLPADDIYGGMCEREYIKEAIDLAVEALRMVTDNEKCDIHMLTDCDYCLNIKGLLKENEELRSHMKGMA